MARYCYTSKVLTGKSDFIRAHWANKPKNASPEEIDFWKALGMTGFDCWLQKTEQGDFLIHCLEGSSKEEIFKRLRAAIQQGHPMALKLQAFYKDVLGKDYALESIEPEIECLLDVETSQERANMVKKGFIFPLLAHKEEAHRKSRREAMGAKKSRHIASLKAFDVYQLTSWLQTTAQGKYIVVYSERKEFSGTKEERLRRGATSSEWQEISSELMDQTGLAFNDLSPDVEWLSR